MVSNPNPTTTGEIGEEEQSYGTIFQPLPIFEEMVSNEGPSNSVIPERYIRSEEDRVTFSDDASLQAPVLDLGLLSQGCTQELEKLDMACRDWGFFQVVNHGVREELIERMNNVGHEFFKLPLAEKMKYAMGPITKQGYGQPFTVPGDQKFDWSEPLFLLVYPSEYRKLQLWPITPPEFKEIVEAYSTETRKVGEVLLGALSVMMGMDRNALVELHKEMMQLLRINYYPPCSKPDLVLGLNPHSDLSTISILTQDNDVPGLQIKHNGVWLPIKPLPNALIVNIGDTIEMWSNGKYKSIEHRAVTNATKARMSFITFIDPHYDVEIEPLEHMLDAKQPLKMFKKVKYDDYLKHSLKRRPERKEQIEFFKDN